jgi:hypothetical protein
MPNFDPAQEIPDDQTVITVPVSLPNQFGGVVTGPPSNPDPGAAAAAAARGEVPQFQSFPGLGGSPAPPPALSLVPPPVNPENGAPLNLPPAPAPPAPGAAPPAGRRPPVPPATAAPGGDLSLLQLATAATVPPNAGGDAVDRELAAASAAGAAPAAKPGDLAAGAARAAAAEADQEAALRKQGEIEQQTLAAESAEKRRAADEALKRQAAQEAARAASDAQIQAAREKAQKEPYHSFWADRSLGQRALAMLGIILGGVSWDKNNRNEAVDVLNQAIARDFEKQKEQHAQLWKDVETAQQQGQSLRSNQLQEMQQFRLNQALQLEAVLAEGNKLSANAKNEVGIAALKANNAKLGFARDQALDEARRLGAAAEEAKRHNQAEEAIGRGHLGLARAKATADKGAAEELKVAAALDRQLGKDKVTTGRLAAFDKLNEARAAIATGNPVAIQGAIDSYVRAQTGLGARPGSIKLFTDRLGGSLDQLRAFIEEKKTGALPPAMIKRFTSAVDAATNDNREELKKSRALHEKALLSSPEYKRHPEVVKAHLDDRFSAVSGENAEPAAPALSAADQAAISWAKGHAGDPRAARILQLHGM